MLCNGFSFTKTTDNVVVKTTESITLPLILYFMLMQQLHF